MQRYAVRLAQGGLERLPGRVLTRRLGGKGKGRPKFAEGRWPRALLLGQGRPRPTCAAAVSPLSTWVHAFCASAWES